MPVRDQDAVQPLEPQPGLHDLALGAFAAIYQEAELVVHHDLSGEAAPR
jgi:hypothetical protein